LRDTVRETLDEAVQEAAAVRMAAYAEAESIIAAARKAELADVWKNPAAVPTGRGQSILPAMQWDSAALAAALHGLRLPPWSGPFWFAVPTKRPLYSLEGSPYPIAELVPNTWYLALDQNGQSLIAQSQDGRRGRLLDATGIQRG